MIIVDIDIHHVKYITHFSYICRLYTLFTGLVAGQTVMHCHVHLIPRRAGDTDDPRGGVRGVIPEKRIY